MTARIPLPHLSYDSESEMTARVRVNINILSTGDIKQSRKMSDTEF